MDDKLGIYIHIPFCVQKCRYCDFLSAPADEETLERYVGALCREIRSFPARAEKNKQLASVFIGAVRPRSLSLSRQKGSCARYRTGLSVRCRRAVSGLRR